MKPAGYVPPNHAADQLLELLTVDTFDALVSAAADPKVRDAVANLLAVLVEARDRKHKGMVDA